MDTRDTPEQAELRRSARQLAANLGVRSVGDLDDLDRRARLAAAITDAGWLELRDDSGDGSPLASAVEAAIVADALANAVADAAFLGPLLAKDLARRAGLELPVATTLAFNPRLDGPGTATGSATSATAEAVYAVDARGAAEALVLIDEGKGLHLGSITLGSLAETDRGNDLTRAVLTIPTGTAVRPLAGSGEISSADLVQLQALGLALTCADLVGGMRGVIDVSVEYVKERRQYGVAVGSFQAVQHLLAEAHVLMEGSLSVSLHAAWAVDALEPSAALVAARIAKTYCARAARTINETAVQVHGGIGNTWECIVHVYLRRALLSSLLFGDDAAQLNALADDRLGVH